MFLAGNIFSFTAGAEELDKLVDDFFAWRLDNAPEFGTKFGINNHDDKVEQYTEEAFDKQKVNDSINLTVYKRRIF